MVNLAKARRKYIKDDEHDEPRVHPSGTWLRHIAALLVVDDIPKLGRLGAPGPSGRAPMGGCAPMGGRVPVRGGRLSTG